MTKQGALGPSEIEERLRALPRWVYTNGAIRRTYQTDGWRGSLLVILRNQSASILSRRSGSKPTMTSPSTTMVGVDRLLYLRTSSKTACWSTLTSFTSNSIPFSER